MNRTTMADLIVVKLEALKSELSAQWQHSGPINHCFIDDLLPEELALRIRSAYPDGRSMQVKKSLRELKYVAAQMDQYDPILEEALYAFQDQRIVEIVTAITGLKKLEPDELLYAGGISMMSKGHFLNPHIDNSHDKQREKYRVLNLLYYVSPEWSLSKGGNLEVWPDGIKGSPVTIESKFNRLAIMVTHTQSWHSVSSVLADEQRCCVSNYYFSSEPAEPQEYFHVTSFRGRPEQKLRDLVLRGDIALRTSIRKMFPKGIVKNKHFYDKK
jgi:Rps23 Pro-64 3,4-dihydroxylase Tpa1-like proline 4-hydroxylase